jgi:hypothetical protein
VCAVVISIKFQPLSVLPSVSEAFSLTLTAVDSFSLMHSLEVYLQSIQTTYCTTFTLIWQCLQSAILLHNAEVETNLERGYLWNLEPQVLQLLIFLVESGTTSQFFLSPCFNHNGSSCNSVVPTVFDQGEKKTILPLNVENHKWLQNRNKEQWERYGIHTYIHTYIHWRPTSTNLLPAQKHHVSKAGG